MAGRPSAPAASGRKGRNYCVRTCVGGSERKTKSSNTWFHVPYRLLVLTKSDPLFQVITIWRFWEDCRPGMHMHNSRAKRERAKNSGGRCSVREGKKEESKESGGRERVRAESIGGRWEGMAPVVNPLYQKIENNWAWGPGPELMMMKYSTGMNHQITKN